MSRGRPLALLIMALAAAPPTFAEPDLVVSTAVSLKEPLLAAIDDFAAGPSGRGMPGIDVHAGGSSVLARQVLLGAPSDLLISASRSDAERLIDAGRASHSSVCGVAGNTLVVVIPPGDQRLDALAQLAEPRFERIGVANPRTAPLGRYTAQVMEAAGLETGIDDKRIPAEHARQVLDYVSRGEVDAAVVYATDAARFGDRVSVGLEIDPTLHDPIEYVAVLLVDPGQGSWSERLFDHLCSVNGRERFEEAGFKRWPGPR